MTIVANTIEYTATSRLIVSGQEGGTGGTGGKHSINNTFADDGQNGVNGNGGMLIINSNTTVPESLYNLGASVVDLRGANNGGHGRVTGNPGIVFLKL